MIVQNINPQGLLHGREDTSKQNSQGQEPLISKATKIRNNILRATLISLSLSLSLSTNSP